MFSYIFNLLFPHGLVTPFGVIPEGGGSAGSVTGGATITSPMPDISATQAITGDAAALSVSSTRFNVGFNTKAKTGHFDIYAHQSLTTICAGRQSGLIVGGLTLQVTICPADASSPTTLLSGWVALMPTAPHGMNYPSTVETVSCLPGACAVTISPLVTNSIALPFPPGIRRDVIIRQVIGSNPHLVYAFDTVNIKTIQVVLSGTINLSGIGYWAGFF